MRSYGYGVAVVLLAVALNAQTERQSLLDRHVDQFVVRASPLDALVRLGQEHNIPFGIEYVDSRLLREARDIQLQGVSVGAAIAAILPSDEGYSWKEMDGVIVVTNRKVPQKGTVLDLSLEKFEIKEPLTRQRVSSLLSMAVIFRLEPGKGVLGSDMGADSRRTVEPRVLRNWPVRRILNLIVAELRGAWIVQVPPAALERKVLQVPWWGIVSYPEEATPLSELCCFNPTAVARY